MNKRQFLKTGMLGAVMGLLVPKVIAQDRPRERKRVMHHKYELEHKIIQDKYSYKATFNEKTGKIEVQENVPYYQDYRTLRKIM